ncbi:MAG TPA: adenylate/guanylate cyclase domain-containing protein [Dehalococcoidia bacterium]|nr:adenylate/guanylate cyclase domain-containing protein [Dehalococcoidia bacterium]
MHPETRYAKSGDVNIAYQVVGEGPLDLVWVPGWVSHLEVLWEDPSYARFLQRLASFSRLIMLDKRGTGLSDRVSVKELPILEEQMDDIGAVMDAVGSQRAALFGASEGGSQCTLFAATYPERTRGLILYGAVATNVWSPQTPWAPTDATFETYMGIIEREWGGPVGLPLFAPSMVGDKRFEDWWARLLRLAASPTEAVAILRMLREIDIRHVLPSIRVPNLVIQRAGDRAVHVENGRYLAERILGAKYVELPGDDHMPWVGDADAILDEVQEFLTGVRPAPEPDRVLATVLFTDIVASTERAVKVGDRRWRDLLDSYYALTRKELVRFRGREVKTMGDGFLATFDGPARAVRCAAAISGEAGRLGLPIRAGLHTGECEIMGEDIGGIAVHIGARVAGQAGPGEVLVSSTVKDLVAGSGLRFEERGAHALKGVPEEWRLFAVEPESALTAGA